MGPRGQGGGQGARAGPKVRSNEEETSLAGTEVPQGCVGAGGSRGESVPAPASEGCPRLLAGGPGLLCKASSSVSLHLSARS